MAISKEEESDEEVLLVKNETETVYVLKRHIKIKNAMNAIGRHVEYIYEPFKMIANTLVCQKFKSWR